MAETITFDTHRFVKNLTANGFTETQAEALADEHAHLLNSNLATKADLEKLKGDLQVEIERVKGDLQADLEKLKGNLQVEIGTIKAELEVKIEASKTDLLKWMLTAMIAQTGLIVALIRLL